MHGIVSSLDVYVFRAHVDPDFNFSNKLKLGQACAFIRGEDLGTEFPLNCLRDWTFSESCGVPQLHNALNFAAYHAKVIFDP